jgi:pyridinium-3,5-bisthiocarboxylic acid mononucleotide nickel chelatase
VKDVKTDDQRLMTDDCSMRIAYLDCFSGISGDMFLGALVDAGVSPRLLQETVAQLQLGARLEISRVIRSGISATKVDVYVGDEKDMPREQYWAKSSVAPPSAHNSHSHHHGETSDHAVAVETPHAHDQHSRGLSEIRAIIGKAAISENAKNLAIKIFEALGAAEAKIHDIPVEQVHFHEVGAVDAIVDIVCASVGAEALGVDEIICSPLNVGGGTVQCAHGTFPVPAPATLELLKGAPVYSSGVEAELVTPTGAAIVKTLARRFSALPQMTIEKSGYGAGSRDFPGYPNVLRLTLGELTTAAETSRESVTVLEANLDDLNPQVFGYVLDRLFEQGALDVFSAPIQMKKNRPGTLLTVLCDAERATKLTEIIFQETTTLGVRRREDSRQCLARRWEIVRTPWGDVRIKIASMNGSVMNFSPEYEDCRKIASEHRLPLKAVMQEATRLYLNDAKEEQTTEGTKAH